MSDDSDGDDWDVPGVPRPAAAAVVSPVVRVAQEALAALVAAPVSGRPVDVAAVLTLSEQLQGLGLRELAELDRSGQHTDAGAATAAVWLRRTLVVGDQTARSQVKLAVRVRDELPALGQALIDGDTTLEHLRAVAAGTAGLDPAVVAESQEALVDLIAVAAPARVREELRQRADAIDPALAAETERKRQDRQGLFLDQVPGGSAYLGGQLAPEAAAIVLHGLDLQTEADRVAGDTRGLPARRAAALVGWAQDAALRLASPSGPPSSDGSGGSGDGSGRGSSSGSGTGSGSSSSGGSSGVAQDARSVRTHLLITCTAEQLAVLADGQALRGLHGAEAVAVLTGSIPVDPATLPTGAPVLPDALRRLACDAHLSLVAHQPLTPDPHAVLQPTKHPLWVGRASRTVHSALWRALVVRDRRCVVRGCRRRPAQCQAHHVEHWLDGGLTDLDNLVLLCHQHHHDHHDRGHDLQHHDGRWITAAGWANAPPG